MHSAQEPLQEKAGGLFCLPLSVPFILRLCPREHNALGVEATEGSQHTCYPFPPESLAWTAVAPAPGVLPFRVPPEHAHSELSFVLVLGRNAVTVPHTDCCQHLPLLVSQLESI